MKFTGDKIGHGYLPTYLLMAGHIGPSGWVCEIGVANGESLDMWQALFPHGRVVGVDINQHARWPEGTTRIVAEQDDPILRHILRPSGPFDLIVDDASHNNDRTAATLANLWPLVAPGGYYVIEDWNHAGMICGELAKQLPAMLDERTLGANEIESITYRHGMIILQKVGTRRA